MNIAGIDAGFSGAIAILHDDNGNPVLYDMPTLSEGKHREIDGISLKSLLLIHSVGAVYIEKAQAMPGQGVVSTSRYVGSYEFIKGLLMGLGISFSCISPVTWKKAIMRDMGKDKQASIIRAHQLYPSVTFPRKKDHNRAEALLIAHYGLDSRRIGYETIGARNRLAGEDI